MSGDADLAERDVDGIAGRVRPMIGDVEIANAEREVDRVDVLERRHDIRHVCERKGRRQDRERRTDCGH